MDDLNQLIKNKATSRLQNEVSEYLNNFINHKFFDAISDFKVKITNDGKEDERNIRGFLWSSNGLAFEKIISKFQPKYIERESKEFMDKVESLQQDVQELFNNQPSEY